MVYLDTQTAHWLQDGDPDFLSAAAQRALEANDILISPLVLLEIQYLRECGRTTLAPEELTTRLSTALGARVCNLPFQLVVERALEENWTGDIFDRLIVAQARARDAHLITTDRKILAHYPKALR